MGGGMGCGIWIMDWVLLPSAWPAPKPHLQSHKLYLNNTRRLLRFSCELWCKRAMTKCWRCWEFQIANFKSPLGKQIFAVCNSSFHLRYSGCDYCIPPDQARAFRGSTSWRFSQDSLLSAIASPIDWNRNGNGSTARSAQSKARISYWSECLSVSCMSSNWP